LKAAVKEIFVSDSIKRYIVDIVNRTRNHKSIYLGVSPRGSLSLLKAAQAYALLMNRDFVIPDDIKYLAPFVLVHRVLLKPEARFEGVTAKEVIAELLSRVPAPIHKEQHA
jgi:MoxR-like ATPase